LDKKANRVNATAIHYVAALITGIAALLPMTSKAATDLVPEKLKAEIGGFLGTSYSVELHNGVVRHSAAKPGEKADVKEVVPTVRQWRDFRRALDEINVWSWRTNYVDVRVCDGTAWSVEIRYSDRALDSKGSNSYPGRAGKRSARPEATRAFSSYLAAVKKLLGGLEFK
jgi:hypothetical protein